MSPATEKARAFSYTLVPLADIPHSRAQPTQEEIDAAERLVPVALTESQYATEAYLPRDDSDRSIPYHAWLAYAEDRQLRWAAAEWAIRRLAQRELLIVERANAFSGEAGREEHLIAAWQALVRGDQRSPTAWALAEVGRVMRIVSTPALWEWHRNPVQAIRLYAGADAPSEDLADYCNGGTSTGHLLTPTFCRKEYSISGSRLTHAAQADPAIRRKNPKRQNEYIYRWVAVRELAGLNEK